MKKSLLCISLFCLASLAQSHELWVNAPDHIDSGSVLHADLAYHHDFPYAEKIAPDREHIFRPLQLTDSKGKTINLVQKGELNYQYVSAHPLKTGTYWVNDTYQPTFWTNGSNGWKQGNLTNDSTATYCEQSQMFGKRLLIVGNSTDTAAISRPIGQTLEIVPLAPLSTLKLGQPFPLQILYQGKPLAGSVVTATADTFIEKDLTATHDHREPQAFSAKTDKEGKVNLIPLVEGLWKVKATNTTPYADSKVCQKSVSYATLVFPIGTARRSAPAMQHEHHHH